MSYCEVRYEHFKREDSTNSIIVTLFDDDQVTPIVPNSSHSWSAKVAKEEDEEKYVGEYPVQISGNEIILTSDRLVRLPRGTYLMELWENNNGKVTIYPSADFIQFTIHKNATDTMGHVDPTTDINKIIDDLHKAGQNIKLGTVTTGAPGSSVIIRQRLENGQNLLDFTIPRGDKGDKGDKGDQGERGPQGIQGIQGPQGKTGQTGPVGPAPTLRVGSVTKVAPGGTPTASVTGSNGDYSLNLGVPEGQQGAPGGVLNWTKVDLSTSDYDQNTWYPVVMDTIGASSKFETIAVSRPLNDGWGKPTWSTHSRGFDGVYQYRVIYPFFGAIPPICYIDAEHSYFVSDGKSPVHLDIHANNGGYVLYLRGGSKYEVGYSGNANNWKIFETDYNFNSLSFAPTTTEPTSFNKLRKAWPSTSVINLQTLTEIGGEINSQNLFSGDMPTLFYKPQAGTPVDSTERLGAQWFDTIPDNMEVLLKTDHFLDVKKGDTIGQSFVLRTDGDLEVINLTFWAKVQFVHHIVPATIEQLGKDLYRVSGTYTFTQDDQLRMMDIHRFKATGASYVSLTAPRVWLDSVGGGGG